MAGSRKRTAWDAVIPYELNYQFIIGINFKVLNNYNKKSAVSIIDIGGVSDPSDFQARFPATVSVAHFIKCAKGSTSYWLANEINSEDCQITNLLRVGG